MFIFSRIFRNSLATQPTLAGALYGAGAGLAINASWRIACPVSTLWHALGAHGAAIIATTALGAVIGRFVGNRKLHAVRVGQVGNLRPIVNRPSLKFSRELFRVSPLSTSEQLPHSPSTALFFSRAARLPHMATERKPPGESRVSAGDYFRKGLCRNGPPPRYRFNWPALAAPSRVSRHGLRPHAVPEEVYHQRG